jgi:uncharacterized membrane protein YwzB
MRTVTAAVTLVLVAMVVAWALAGFFSEWLEPLRRVLG